MFFEMMCSCSASLHLDVGVEREDAALLLVNRFTMAHVTCGFMTPLLEELPSPTKKFNIKTTYDKDA